MASGMEKSYHIVGELELEVWHGRSRSIVPWKTGIGRELPMLDHVGVFIVEYSVVFVSC